ncbi:MAG: response regulator [Spartobacteria bacterium]|nr:response regulator [Spartobacteria bacterium]
MMNCKTGQMRVMMVEDDYVSGARVSVQLAALGYEDAGWSRDGLDAVEMARKEGPDIILMDIMLPGINGIEATQRIMAERPVPVVAMTSVSEPSFTRKVTECGVCGFVSKPMNKECLAAALALAPFRFKQRGRRTLGVIGDNMLHPLLLTHDVRYAVWIKEIMASFDCKVDVTDSPINALGVLNRNVFSALLIDTAALSWPSGCLYDGLHSFHAEVPVIKLVNDYRAELDELGTNAQVVDVLMRNTDAPDFWRAIMCAHQAVICKAEDRRSSILSRMGLLFAGRNAIGSAEVSGV